jgi:hypothetical protein
MVSGLGFGLWGLGFRVSYRRCASAMDASWKSGFTPSAASYLIDSELGFRGLGFRVQGFGFRG